MKEQAVGARFIPSRVLAASRGWWSCCSPRAPSGGVSGTVLPPTSTSAIVHKRRCGRIVLGPANGGLGHNLTGPAPPDFLLFRIIRGGEK